MAPRNCGVNFPWNFEGPGIFLRGDFDFFFGGGQAPKGSLRGDFASLGGNLVLPYPILSRDANLSSKPPETQQKQWLERMWNQPVEVCSEFEGAWRSPKSGFLLMSTSRKATI